MARRRRSRGLTSVLFTDIVDSTHVASEMGDRRWRELLARHHRLVRRELRRFGGREVDTAGDGFFATFEQPASGLRCAAAIAEAVRDLGVEIRGGLHVGEIESANGQTRGIAVHIGARITSFAGPGEVLVSGTVHDLVAGAGLDFEDLGERELKGVPGRWRLFRVVAVDGAPVPPPLEEEEAGERRRALEAPPLIRRRRGLIGLLAMSLVALAAAVFYATRGEPTLSAIPAASVGRIDPIEAEITDAFELGSAPTGIAVGRDAVWVISLGAETLTRLNPDTGSVGPTVSTQGGPTNVAVDADGTIWVLNQFPEGTLVWIDASGSTLADKQDVGAGTNDMAVGEGAVWLTNEVDQTLLRFDPQTNDLDTVLSARELKAPPQGVAVGGGFVWIATGRDVLRLDPVDGEVDRTSLRFRVSDIAFGEGSLWASHISDDEVSKIAPGTLSALSIEAPDAPGDIETGSGYVWVAHPARGVVLRVDPRSLSVKAIDVGNAPEAIAADGGAVWIAVGSR